MAQLSELVPQNGGILPLVCFKSVIHSDSGKKKQPSFNPKILKEGQAIISNQWTGQLIQMSRSPKIRVSKLFGIICRHRCVQLHLKLSVFGIGPNYEAGIKEQSKFEVTCNVLGLFMHEHGMQALVHYW